MRSVVKHMLGSLLAAVALFVVTAPAQASIINGSFETGDFTGWSVSSGFGNVVNSASGLGNAPGWNPVHGNKFAHVQTGAGTGVYSLLSQSFNAGIGDSLSFSIFFDTGDYYFPPYNDNGYAKLIDSVTNVLVANLYYKDVSTVGDFGWSGWDAINYTFVSSGSFKLEFGVTNTGDNLFDSAVGVDNVSLVSAVPVPSAVVLFALGLVCVPAFRVIRSKKNLITA